MLSTGGSYPWIAMPSVGKHVLTRLRLPVATGSAACGHRQTQHPQKLIDDHGSAYALL